MSLNQEVQVGVAGFGGALPGQYEPLSVPVTTKTSNNKLTGALVRGEVITVEKFGSTRGGIRKAVSGDIGPFGMVFTDAGINDTRVEFISLQVGFIGYLTADGTIFPGQNVVVASTAGQVQAELTTETVTGSADEIVGVYISKATEVSKSGSGVYKPSNAADDDIVRVAFASTRGEIF